MFQSIYLVEYYKQIKPLHGYYNNTNNINHYYWATNNHSYCKIFVCINLHSYVRITNQSMINDCLWIILSQRDSCIFFSLFRSYFTFQNSTLIND